MPKDIKAGFILVIVLISLLLIMQYIWNHHLV